MADMTAFDETLPLGQALSRLPLATPDHSAWPALAARLQAKQRPRRRWPYTLAAAALLATIMLPRMAPPDAAPQATATNAGSSSEAELSALMTESARLERLVAAASDDGASSASAAALSLALEERLRALDRELAVSDDSGRQLPLWQQRVDLLRDVARLQTSRHYLAAQGLSFDVALVAAY
jgi:hypothetical protein